MAHEATVEQKARIVRSGHSQSVRLPAAFRFKGDEVYIRRDEQSGAVTLFEKPVKPSWEEVFRLFDEARAAGETLEIERDQSPLRDINL
jgi:antitoxin VapB